MPGGKLLATSAEPCAVGRSSGRALPAAEIAPDEVALDLQPAQRRARVRGDGRPVAPAIASTESQLSAAVQRGAASTGSSAGVGTRLPGGSPPHADAEQLVEDVLGAADRRRAVLQQVVRPAGDAST